MNIIPYKCKELINLFAYSIVYEDYKTICIFNEIQDYKPSKYSAVCLRKRKEYWDLQLRAAKLNYYHGLFYKHFHYEEILTHFRYIDKLYGENVGEYYLTLRKYTISFYLRDQPTITYKTAHDYNDNEYFSYKEPCIVTIENGDLIKEHPSEYAETSANLFCRLLRITGHREMFNNFPSKPAKDMDGTFKHVYTHISDIACLREETTHDRNRDKNRSEKFYMVEIKSESYKPAIDRPLRIHSDYYMIDTEANLYNLAEEFNQGIYSRIN